MQAATSASSDQPRAARRVRREADEILLEWGGYRRTYAEVQGSLHRVPRGKDAHEDYDRCMTRSPGTHSDPVFANLAAEEALQIRRISSFDRQMRSYPMLWQQVATAVYVDCLSLERVAKALSFNERGLKGALSMIKRQAEIDWAHTALMDARQSQQIHVSSKAA